MSEVQGSFMMGVRSPSWELFGTFLQVMREGSFTGAARVLQITQPTVRRRIAALETTLDSPLFSRAFNGLKPTELAHRMLPFAETMEATSRSLVRAASAAPSAMAGTVRVAASELVGVEVLPRLLSPLLHKHPELQIELVVSNALADVSRRDADIAVRMAPLKGASLVARRIGQVMLGFFASPGYLAERAEPTVVADLREHDLVGHDTNPQLLEGLASMGLRLAPRDFRVRTDHDLTYLAAVRAGLGIGVTHLSLASGLVRVLPEIGLPVDLWLVVHEDLRQVRRIRVVLDHLAEALGHHVNPGASLRATTDPRVPAL